MEQPKQKEQDSIQIWGVPELAPKVKKLAEEEERTISKPVSAKTAKRTF